MNTILEIHAKQSGVITRTIVKKYYEVIEDARFFVREMNMSKQEAANVAASDWSFDTEEERSVLMNWFKNSFKG
jgi:hypothetical protein